MSNRVSKFQISDCLIICHLTAPTLYIGKLIVKILLRSRKDFHYSVEHQYDMLDHRQDRFLACRVKYHVSSVRHLLLVNIDVGN